MTPKLTPEMREALHRTHGRPLDVEDDEERKVYVLVEKDAFVQLQGLQTDVDDETRGILRKLVREGIDSGPGVPADQALAELRKYAETLAGQRS